MNTGYIEEGSFACGCMPCFLFAKAYMHEATYACMLAAALFLLSFSFGKMMEMEMLLLMEM